MTNGANTSSLKMVSLVICGRWEMGVKNCGRWEIGGQNCGRWEIKTPTKNDEITVQ